MTMKKVQILIILSIILVVGTLVGCDRNYDNFHSTQWERYDLIAIQCGTTTSGGGGFFLFSSSLNTKAVFYFYTRDTDGSIMLRKVSPNYAVIYEQEGQPYCNIKESYCAGWYVCDAEFFIPEGSVLHNYELTTP